MQEKCNLRNSKYILSKGAVKKTVKASERLTINLYKNNSVFFSFLIFLIDSVRF